MLWDARGASSASGKQNLIGALYQKRTGKSLAILGGNADNITKGASHEFKTESGPQAGSGDNRGNAEDGGNSGATESVARPSGQAGPELAGSQEVTAANKTPDASAVVLASAPSGVTSSANEITNPKLVPVSKRGLSEHSPDGNVASNVAENIAPKESTPALSAGDKEKGKESFVKAPGGSIDFGEITTEIAGQIKREPAKIKLQQGTHDEETGKGYGLVHVEAGHSAR